MTREIQPYGPDLNIDGVIDFIVDEKAMYGIRIVNDTAEPLYPYLFYFDNTDFSISECLCTDRDHY
jgi:hypothetical protein